MAYQPFSAINVTNKCVVLCDLREWSGSESPAWKVLNGSQDEIGCEIASLLEDVKIQRIDDFGGVSKSFLCDGDRYRDNPPRIKGIAAVFSFTPKNRIAVEAQEMARVAKLAGYKLLVMPVQKDDKYGKVWVLRGALRYLAIPSLTYYEDTGSIIDELKSYPEGQKIVAVHIQVQGYEDSVAQLADRIISQVEYLQEVLEKPG